MDRIREFFSRKIFRRAEFLMGAVAEKMMAHMRSFRKSAKNAPGFF